LATAGYGDVRVITADGAQGHPDRAPFDRVPSTVAAPRVPYAWVAQTRARWADAHPVGQRLQAGLLSLTVRTDGTATGGLVNTTISFMELRDPGSGSWARFDYQPDTRRWPIHQFGPRRLWDEVTAAYQQWEHAGRPAVTQWRFTITPDGQQVKLTDAIPGGQRGHHKPNAPTTSAPCRTRLTSYEESSPRGAA
jgi:hypothetical protein